MLRQASRLCRVVNSLTVRPQFRMGDKWREREESAENLYISQKEKDLLKKLLRKVEDEGRTAEEESDEFSNKLKAILGRYGVNNEALEAEIINLHMRYD